MEAKGEHAYRAVRRGDSTTCLLPPEDLRLFTPREEKPPVRAGRQKGQSP